VAQVRSIADSVRELAGGLDHFEVEAVNVRALLAALDARYPGMNDLVRETMAVAIDGDIHPAPWNQALAPDAEVVFIPAIGAG